MNINLHVDRLVLDGLNVGPGGGASIGRAVEAELSRLLSEGGLAPGLRSGGSIPAIRGGSIGIGGDEKPSKLGREIARSVYNGIGESK